MQTSYFAAIRKMKDVDPDRLVSIARWKPFWFDGPEALGLAPHPELLRAYKSRNIDQAEYTRIFQMQLDALFDGAEGVVRDLGEDAILLCYERPGDFCHRRLVAAWIERETGLVVPEWSAQ